MKELFWHDEGAIEYIKKIIKKGEIVLAEGDTVLGLLADISEQGYKELDHIKNRSSKPYLLLVANREKALNLIEKNTPLSFQIEKLMNFFWPGPLTLICKAKKDLPWYIRSSQDTIAIRVPKHQGLLELLQYFDGLFSTSANKSGEPVPNSLSGVDKMVKEQVICLVKNNLEDNEDNDQQLPSTIIDCSGEQIKIIRKGAFSIEQLTDFLQ